MTPEAERFLEGFWYELAAAPASVLLLDYDGTLAPFRVERDQACPYPGVRKRLTALLEHTGTRVVIVSGRSVADLLPLLDLEPQPEIWGCHGWERRLPGGDYQVEQLPPPARAALDAAAGWIEEQGLSPRSECKPVAVTLHWRGLAEGEIRRLQAAAEAAWRPLARSGGLELHPFDGGLELRHPGRDKGDAVAAVLAELPAGAAVAYLGDDLTDEDAFKALGKRGLGVLVRPRQRPSAASLWLHPPQELLAFLDGWLDHAGKGDSP